MNPYTILGVDRNASQEDIKRAYRKLASQHHPDKSQGDTKKFQEIQSAYDVLSNTDKRTQFDNPSPHSAQGTNFNFGNMNDLFNMFNMHSSGMQARQTYNFAIHMNLEQIIQDSIQTLQINTAKGPKFVEITIPSGVDSGQTYRYDNIIENASIQVTFVINQHPKFNRVGMDLYSTIEVGVLELIAGTKIKFVTLHGKELEINLNKLSKPDNQLRLSGQGLSNKMGVGDQFILIKPTIPDTISDSLLSAIEQEIQKRKV